MVQSVNNSYACNDPRHFQSFPDTHALKPIVLKHSASDATCRLRVRQRQPVITKHYFIIIVDQRSLSNYQSMMNIVRTISLAALFVASQSIFVVGFSPVVRVSSPRSSIVLQSTISAVDTTTDIDIDIANNDNKVNELAAKLLSTCKAYGQIGTKLTEEQRAEIDDIASQLSDYSGPAPAKNELQGRHELIYSASPGGSSGALGPFVGKVSQSFLDDTKFINRVELFGGAVNIELNAERKVLNENRIRVMFKRTDFFLFGNEVKSGEVKGSGVWDIQFFGKVNVDGENMLLRVMKTPSTFVIVQKE